MDDKTPRYVVKTHLEHRTGRDRRASGYWIVDTTGVTAAIWQEHRVDAQGRANRWNRNAARPQ